jgi:deaminated glutathione amidase
MSARAIECQAFILAAAQYGKHNEKRESYGHSLIIDPWGKILADAGGFDSPDKCNIRTPTIIVCDIDINLVNSVRQHMPVQKHRDASKEAVIPHE